jgi:hypothetical protein
MIEYQINTPVFIDVVDFLRQNNPKLCFELISKVENINSMKILKDNLKSELFNKVLTARRDGTTERLNAIVHGVALSNIIGWPFEFSWVVDTGAVTNNLLSVDSHLPSFFNKSFIKKYYITFDKFKEKYDVRGYDSTMCEFVSGTEYRYKPSNKELLDTLNILAPTGFEKGVPLPNHEIIKKVLSPIYFEFHQNVESRLSNFVGLHYRGGDVIYGINRHGVHAIGNKSVPLGVLEHYINENSNEKFILFGTPVGDTQTDMDYIVSKYNNVILAETFRRADLDHVIQDCFLMASCKKVISMSGTGVTRFASIINNKLAKKFFNQMFIKGSL